MQSNKEKDELIKNLQKEVISTTISLIRVMWRGNIRQIFLKIRRLGVPG